MADTSSKPGPGFRPEAATAPAPAGQRMPLAGVRVVDFGCWLAGPLTGMLLADQGADVIKIDPVTGPLLDHPVNAVLNRGKTCLRRDLRDDAQRREVMDLIANADIVIENFGPGVADRLGISAQHLRMRWPELIIASLPGFASAEDLGGTAEAFEGIIAAATAQYTNIHAAREIFGLDPVYTALPLGSVYAAIHAATAIVLALRGREAGGGGATIVAPLASAALSAMTTLHLMIENQPERYAAPRLPKVLRRFVLPLMRGVAAVGGAKVQGALLNIARGSYPALMNSYPCADGRLLYIFAIDNSKLARALLSGLDLLDAAQALGLIFADPYKAGDRDDNLSEASNLSRKAQRQLRALIAARLLTRSAQAWEAELSARGVTCAMQRSTQEWLHLHENDAAGITTDLEDPEHGVMRQPGVLTWLSGAPNSGLRPAARRLMTNGSWEGNRAPASAIAAIKPLPPPGSWLAGLTVIDMTSMVAGPVAARTLAEYGARVIKLEPTRPNHGPRLTCWYGLDGNAGKQSILLDLKTRQGRSALDRLLAQADILVTNHTVAAMAALRLGEAELRTARPNLIYCRVGAYNGPAGGPWADRRGYDPVLQAASGIMTRYGDAKQPELHAIASCVDALTGYSAAFGMALALRRRSLDGGGCRVDASLAAAATLVQLPYAFHHAGMAHTEPSGQRARGEKAFYRLYRAKDGWFFLAAPQAQAPDLPKLLRPAGAPDDAALAKHLERQFRRLSVDALVALLATTGLSATRVRSVASLGPLLTGRTGDGLRLRRYEVAGLGPVTTAPAQQITAGGALRSLEPAEQPGSSTGRILAELGFDAATFVATGAAARAFTDAYLPE